MKCVLCHRNCRNACSRGNHGWCANCRDASGFGECSRCRANKAARYQQSKQATQQSRAAIAAANAPVYVPSQPITAPLRKALYQMSEAELEAWAKSIDTALSDMQARNEAYITRRAARGTVTSTDIARQRDNRVAEDIKEAMAELPILYRMAHTAISTGSGGPATGMLMEYDYNNGKVKP